MNNTAAGIGDVRAGTNRQFNHLGTDGIAGLKNDATSYSFGSAWEVHHIYSAAGSSFVTFNAQMASDGGGTSNAAWSTTVSMAPLGEAARTKLTIKFGSGTGIVWATLANGLAAMFQDDPLVGTIISFTSATYYELFGPSVGPGSPKVSGTSFTIKTVSGTVATFVTADATVTGSLNTQRMIVYGTQAGVSGTVRLLDVYRYATMSDIDTNDGWPTFENGDVWAATFYVDVYSGTIGVFDAGEWI